MREIFSRVFYKKEFKDLKDEEKIELFQNTLPFFTYGTNYEGEAEYLISYIKSSPLAEKEFKERFIQPLFERAFEFGNELGEENLFEPIEEVIQLFKENVGL